MLWLNFIKQRCTTNVIMKKIYAGYALLLALLCFAFNARSQTDDLMIVEYMDASCGSGFQVKAVESDKRAD